MPGLKLDKKLLEKSPLFKWLFLSSPLAIFPNGNGKVQGNNPVFFKSDYGGISNKTEFELELRCNLGLHLSRENASLWSLHPAPHLSLELPAEAKQASSGDVFSPFYTALNQVTHEFNKFEKPF